MSPNSIIDASHPTKNLIYSKCPTVANNKFLCEADSEESIDDIDIIKCPVLRVTAVNFPIAIEFGEDCESVNANEIIIEINALASAIKQIIISDDELSVNDRKKILSQCIKEMIYHVNGGNIRAAVAARTIHSIGAVRL